MFSWYMEFLILFTFFLSLAFTKLSIIIAKNYIKKFQPIRDYGPQSHKATKVGTPIFGGFAILSAILISTILIWVFFAKSSVSGISLICFTIFSFILGFADDAIKLFKQNNNGLNGKLRLIIEFIAATVLIYTLKHYGLIKTTVWLPIPFLETRLINLGMFYYPLAIFVIASIINSTNLTDGLDGLCATQTTIILAFFAFLSFYFVVFALPQDVYLITICLIFAILGFLVYNANPATTFMGEAGSLMLGGFLSVIVTITASQFIIILVGSVLLIESLSVMLQVTSFRLRNGKRIFKMSPIHHHFELSGFKENKIVLNAIIFTIIMCIICFTSFNNFRL